jgi:SAM-dependent methyltransferase
MTGLTGNGKVAESPTADDGQGEFFGVFEGLRRYSLPPTSVIQPYEGFHAGVYDALTSRNIWDVDLYLSALSQNPGTVLELACGAGRLTLPLLRAGHRVYAVDRSADLLAKLRARIRQEGLRRPRLIAADIRTFDLGRRFDVILLGGLTISLLPHAADRARVFRQVTRHLTEGGVFFLDLITAPLQALIARSGGSLVFPLRGRSGRGFTIVGWMVVARRRIQMVNMFSEWADADGHIARFLSSLTTHLISPRGLRNELRMAGLRVVATFPVRHRVGDQLVDEGVSILRCLKTSDRGQ